MAEIIGIILLLMFIWSLIISAPGFALLLALIIAGWFVVKRKLMKRMLDDRRVQLTRLPQIEEIIASVESMKHATVLNAELSLKTKDISMVTDFKTQKKIHVNETLEANFIFRDAAMADLFRVKKQEHADAVKAENECLVQHHASGSETWLEKRQEQIDKQKMAETQMVQALFGEHTPTDRIFRPSDPDVKVIGDSIVFPYWILISDNRRNYMNIVEKKLLESYYNPMTSRQRRNLVYDSFIVMSIITRRAASVYPKLKISTDRTIPR